MTFCLPESLKIVQMLTPRVGNGAATSDYVSLKDAQKAWVVIDVTEGGAEAVTFTLLKATAVLPSNSTTVTSVFRIWSNLATATNDLLVERTAAASYAYDAAATSKQIIFEVEPADLGSLAGTGPYTCIALYCNAPNAADYISASCYMLPRYATRVLTSPSAIID